jgi:hypothetical protein
MVRIQIFDTSNKGLLLSFIELWGAEWFMRGDGAGWFVMFVHYRYKLVAA